MNKKNLVQFIIQQLETDMVMLREAARATYEAATHEESKPENEYDTRGLEAAYLAGAQAKRVGEVEELLSIYKYIQIKDFTATEAISSTALVQIALNDRKSYVFLMSKGGGMVLSFEGHPIQIVTPNSPLGEALLGLKSGDTAVVEKGKQILEYEILSVQ